MRIGSIMLREGIGLPKSVPLVTTNYAQGWSIVIGHDNFSLDRKLRTVGWGLLFIAGEVKSFSVGPHGDSVIDRTVRKVLAKVRAQHLNCASISAVANRRFLGLPYTVVSGYSYNLQEGLQLQSSPCANVSTLNTTAPLDEEQGTLR
jgi:hypothetical protein